MYRASLACAALPKISRGGSHLILSGHLLDIITQCSDIRVGIFKDQIVTPWDLFWKTYQWRKSHINWRSFAGIPAIPSTKSAYVTGEHLEDVYWQTLIVGEDGTASQTSDASSTKGSYFQYRQQIHFDGYLRCLPSPIFEFSLMIFVILTLIFRLGRILLGLPQPTVSSEISNSKIMMDMCIGRKLIKTRVGLLGLAGASVAEGDEIVICKGGQTPMIVRRNRDSDTFEFLGDCYVHGVMYGEAFRNEDCEDICLH